MKNAMTRNARLLAMGMILAAGNAIAQKHLPDYPMPDQQAQTDLAIPPANAGAAGQSSGSSGLTVEAGTELAEPQAASARPKPRTQGDVTYLCGGVGEEEARYMKQAAHGYDLMLTFAAQDGSYLANVDVDIRDAQGKAMLQAKCDGPMLLVDLPKSGTYQIRADAAGYSVDKTAKVRHGVKKGALAGVTMVWPQQVADAPARTGTATGSGAAGEGQVGK